MLIDTSSYVNAFSEVIANICSVYKLSIEDLLTKIEITHIDITDCTRYLLSSEYCTKEENYIENTPPCVDTPEIFDMYFARNDLYNYVDCNKCKFKH